MSGAALADPKLLALALVVEVGVLAFAEHRLAGAFLSRWPVIGYALIAPGTVLHETAHLVMALALNCRVRRFVPFWPHREPDGSVRLGYVLFDQVGPLRNALVAIAPLVLVPPALLGISFALLGTADPAAMVASLESVGGARTAAWLVIMTLGSRAAFPSPGDRLGLVGGSLLAVLVVALLVGAMTWGGADAVNALLVLAVTALAIPAIVDVALLAAREVV